MRFLIPQTLDALRQDRNQTADSGPPMWGIRAVLLFRVSKGFKPQEVL